MRLLRWIFTIRIWVEDNPRWTIESGCGHGGEPRDILCIGHKPRKPAA